MKKARENYISMGKLTSLLKLLQAIERPFFAAAPSATSPRISRNSLEILGRGAGNHAPNKYFYLI